MELYDGRPENTDGRQDNEIRVYDLLDSLGIQYKRTDHEPATTMEVCRDIDAVLDTLICKNLFLCKIREYCHILKDFVDFSCIGRKHLLK